MRFVQSAAVVIGWTKSSGNKSKPPSITPAARGLMMTSSNGNTSRVTGPLWEESTGDRRIPFTNTSGAELWCFLWFASEQTVSNRAIGDLRRHRAHYDLTVMCGDLLNKIYSRDVQSNSELPHKQMVYSTSLINLLIAHWNAIFAKCN